jgi:ubiquinone/menaquinone biosynthesis C-methylase UbiE
MQNEKSHGVCPVESAGILDNFVRKWIQNPRKIMRPYIEDNMTVLDFGCGPGFFSIEIAKMLKRSGEVIAADVQEGMLDIIRKKIKGTEYEQKIILHKCEEHKIGLSKQVDLVLAFYSIHEVSDKERLFKELVTTMKADGQIFIVEPKFHVSKKLFLWMIDSLSNLGLEIVQKPEVIFSRAVIMKRI